MWQSFVMMGCAGTRTMAMLNCNSLVMHHAHCEVHVISLPGSALCASDFL